MVLKYSKMAFPDDLLLRLDAVVGDKGLTTDAATMAPFLMDERGMYQGEAIALVRPASAAEVAAVVRLCARAGTPIVPQGGNTGLCGAATPHEHGGEILLSLTRMNRVRAVDPLNYTITVEAGVILADVQKAAADADRLFPLSLGGEGTARIGGNLSTNAGGTGVLRYGTARDLALGLEVVLPDGRIWDGLTALRKDNTGYDLKQLFIGAEGTLGVITAAVLKLFPRANDVQTAFVAVKDPEAAIELLSRARNGSGDRVSAFELMLRLPIEFVLRHVPGARDPLSERHGYYILLELASSEAGADLKGTMEAVLADAMAAGLIIDGAIAASAAQAADFWKLRETIPEAQKHEGVSVKHDVSVPVAQVAAFMADATARVMERVPGVRVCAFGHVGDGNIHFNLSQPEGADGASFQSRQPEINRAVYETAIALGGSISAEHGIGRLRRDELSRYKPEVALDIMRRIKAALDPDNIMNPGKVI